MIPFRAEVHYKAIMYDAPKFLPTNPVELVNARALQIEKLKHQPAGHQKHRFGSKLESAGRLNLQL